MLSLTDIAAGYGRQRVLHDISQDIDTAAITAIVGPNGHGKSTLMATISGLLPVMAGTIRFDGTDLTRLSPQKRLGAGLVHVPQGDRLFPEMSVEDNLLIGGTVLGDRERIADRLRAVYEMLPMVAERRERLCSGLSGGERRLVGIARGLMTGRRFMMLDEPSLGLSPVAVEQVYGIIRRLAGDGYGFLIIEENLDRVSDLAAHLIVLENGRIEWAGAPDALASGGGALKKFLGG